MISQYDNFHGDEMECHGHCGLCDDCNNRFYAACDEEYEAWRDEDLFN